MPIRRVEELTYGVADVEACTRFFADLGLELVDRGHTGADLRTLENQLVRVRPVEDAGLPAALQSGSTLRQTVWGVESKETLGAIAADLSRDRELRCSPDGSLFSHDQSGWPCAFRQWRCTPVQSAAPAANAAGSAPRVNRPLEHAERVRPIRIVHVVYEIPLHAREAASAFYLDRLKFRLTDRSLDAGDFMRCEGSLDHHNLLLLHRANRLAYNHIALEVRDLDEMMIAGLHLKRCGWKPARRPGRHFLGSNLEWFFESPCGGRVELLADMDRMDDRWQPRIWDRHPGQAIWLADV